MRESNRTLLAERRALQTALEEARAQTGRAHSDLVSSRSRHTLTQSRLDAMGVELERIKAERSALERVLTCSSARTVSTAAGAEAGSAEVDAGGDLQPPDSARTDDAVPPLPLDALPMRAPFLHSEDEWLQLNSRLKVQSYTIMSLTQFEVN